MIKIESAQTGNGVSMFHNVYAHGELESLIGYDLIGSKEPANLTEGVHLADYRGSNVMIFCWQGRHGLHGLAVMATDSESMEYAAEAFKNKLDSL